MPLSGYDLNGGYTLTDQQAREVIDIQIAAEVLGNRLLRLREAALLSEGEVAAVNRATDLLQAASSALCTLQGLAPEPFPTKE